MEGLLTAVVKLVDHVVGNPDAVTGILGPGLGAGREEEDGRNDGGEEAHFEGSCKREE